MPWAYGDDDFAGREGGDRSDRREESAGKEVEVFFSFPVMLIFALRILSWVG